MRAVALIAALGERHALTVLAPRPGRDAPPPPAGLPARLVLYTPRGLLGKVAGVARAALTGRPLQSGLFGGRDLARKLLRLAPEADLVIVSLLRLAEALPALAGKPAGKPVILDLIDSLALNLERRAAWDRAWKRPALLFEARRLARAEDRVLGEVARAWVVAERDRVAIAARTSPERAAKLAVLPLPFDPAPADLRARDATGGAAPLLALTGNLGYFPTFDGACFLLDEVWPRLQARLPALRLVLAGARPPRALARRVARAGAGVELIASPPDLRAVLARATLTLAPLRAGSGQPLKVLEAWALGVPVVATPWAAAGTPAIPGRDLAVAETPEEWVETILRLLADPAERARLAAGGRRLVEEGYGRTSFRRRLAHELRVASG